MYLPWDAEVLPAKVIVLHHLAIHEMIADFVTCPPRIGESFRLMRKIIVGRYKYYVSPV